MAEPYLKLYRKLLKWEWYDDPNTCRLFIHCLLRANWKPSKWHGIDLEPGQFITSLQKLSVETGLSIKQVRVALDHLKDTGEVADLRQGNSRIITVIKWNVYQSMDKPMADEWTDQGQTEGNVRADQGQTKGKPGATDKEYKEYINNIKDIKEEKETEEPKNTNTPCNPPKGEPVYYPNDELLNQAFKDYVEMRKKIKCPMTDRAIQLAINKIDKLSGGDNDKAIEILNESVMNSWRGIFELKEHKNKDRDKGITNAESWFAI